LGSSFEGKEEFNRKITEFAERFPREAAGALYAVALEIENVSKERTPVRYGILRASHETKIEMEPEIRATIEVGGPSAPYAWYVHEDMEAHHEVGQAKFLESAMMEAGSDLPRRLAAHIDFSKLEK